MPEKTELFSKKNIKFDKLKHTVFLTFHRILSRYCIKEMTAQVLILFQFLQLVAMVINEQNSIQVKIIDRNILELIHSSTFYHLMLKSKIPTKIIASFVIGIFEIYLIYGFIKIFNFDERENKKYDVFKQFYGTMLTLIDLVQSIPILGYLISLFFCGKKTGFNECFNWVHITFIVFGSFQMFIFLCFSTIVWQFFFNFNFKLRDSLSRTPNMMHFVSKIFQIVAVICDVTLESNVNQNEKPVHYSKLTIVLAGHTFYSLQLCIDYYNRQPYYNAKVSETYCFCVYSYFWVNIIFLLTHQAEVSQLLDNVIYIIVVGLLFFLYIVKKFREKFTYDLIIKEIEEINNEIHLDIRFRYLMNIVKNATSNKQDELLLTSIIKVHVENCTNIQCICKNRHDLFDPKKNVKSNKDQMNFKDPVFVKHYLLKLIKDSTKKYPSSNSLNIDYFLFLFNAQHNLPMANYQILLFEKYYQKDLFITVQYCIYRMRISMLQHLKNHNKHYSVSNIRYENVHKYDKSVIKLKKKFSDTIDTYGRMWDILNDSRPDLFLLKNVCDNLSSLKESTLDVYKKLQGITTKCYELFLLMTIYAKYIVLDDVLQNKVRKTIQINYIQKITDPRNVNISIYAKKINILNYDCCSLTINLNQENLGQINWTSSHCERIFGYDSNTLRTLNIANLMPTLISENHNYFIDKFFSRGENKLLNKMVYLYAIDDQKNLFTILLSLKLYFKNEGLNVISLLQGINKVKFMILNSIGEINCIGVKWSSLFEVEAGYFYSNQCCPIALFCPRLIPLFLKKYYEIPEFKLKNFEFKKLENLYMAIPKYNMKILRQLSEEQALIKAKHNNNYNCYIKEYCIHLCSYLNGLKISVIDKQYRISIEINFRNFQDKVELYEIKLLSAKKVVYDTKKLEQIWKREKSFVRKLRFDNALIKSLNKVSEGMNDIAENILEKKSLNSVKSSKKILKVRPNANSNSSLPHSSPLLMPRKLKESICTFGSPKTNTLSKKPHQDFVKIKLSDNKSSIFKKTKNMQNDSPEFLIPEPLASPTKKNTELDLLNQTIKESKDDLDVPIIDKVKNESNFSKFRKNDTFKLIKKEQIQLNSEKVIAQKMTPDNNLVGSIYSTKTINNKKSDIRKKSVIVEKNQIDSAPLKNTDLKKFSFQLKAIKKPDNEKESTVQVQNDSSKTIQESYTNIRSFELDENELENNQVIPSGDSIRKEIDQDEKQKDFNNKRIQSPEFAQSNYSTMIETKVPNKGFGLTTKMRGMLKHLQDIQVDEETLSYEAEDTPSIMNCPSSSEEEEDSGNEVFTRAEKRSENSSTKAIKSVVNKYNYENNQDSVNSHKSRLDSYDNPVINYTEKLSCVKYKKYESAVRDAYVSFTNTVNNQKSPLLGSFMEFQIYSSILLCIIQTFSNYFVFKIYSEKILNFNTEVTKLTSISNSFLKVSYYMEYQSLLGPPYNVDISIITPQMDELLRTDIIRANKISQSRFISYISDSLYITKYDSINEFFFWKNSNWQYKDMRQYTPVISYYFSSYIAINNYFKGIEINSNASIIHDNMLNFSEFIQEFNKHMLKEVESLYSQFQIYLSINFSMKILIVIICIIIWYSLQYESTREVRDQLMLFVKIPPKDITHYSVYYCNISLAFKTATKSIENLLRTFQTTYNSEFTDKKRIFESNIINTKGFDDKKSFWLLNGIIACSIALILLCGKLYIIISLGTSVKSNQFFINRFPVLESEMFLNLGFSLNLIGMKLNNEEDTAKYQILNVRYKNIVSEFEETLDSLFRAGNQIEDNEYKTEYKKIWTSNICETYFKKDPDLSNCFSVVELYLKNGLRSLFPVYITGIQKMETVINSSQSETNLRKLINTSVTRDIVINTYWFEKVINYWSKQIQAQFSRKMDGFKEFVLIQSCVESFILTVFLIVLLTYSLPVLKGRSIHSYKFLLLLPYHIIKENHYLRKFLRERLKFENRQ